MKIPEPIIEPITIIVASSRLKPRTSLGLSVGAVEVLARAGLEDIVRSSTDSRVFTAGKSGRTIFQLQTKINNKMRFMKPARIAGVLATGGQFVMSKQTAWENDRVIYSAFAIWLNL